MSARLILLALLAAGCALTPPPAPGVPGGRWAAPYVCHVRGRGLFVLPDPSCTPGVLNPAVTQANISSTICAGGWSPSVRPPEATTEPQKRLELAAYGYYDGHRLRGYELDHLTPVILGGALDSPANLWPEADYRAVSPDSFALNPKDRLEQRLHHLVCSRRLSLAFAQQLIATDWVSAYRRYLP